jgi:hypothetical protein
VKTLECHSQGDRRFSPFFAKVSVFGTTDTIESFYQCAKRFGDRAPRGWRDAKSMQKTMTRTHFQLPNGLVLPSTGHTLRLEFGVQWYVAMWAKYLDANPNLVAYAKEFDVFADPFAGTFPMCQARCIETYVKQGRAALIAECREVLDYIRTH